jgi:inosose dehydratase
MSKHRSDIIVANAPVSYGAFEVTIGFDPNVPDGDDIMDQVSAAGYAGIDLGPVGYLGTTEDLGAKLAKRGLGLAGAYLELPYADPELLEKTLPELDAMLDIFDSIKPLGLGPDPRPTLADLGVGDGADFRRNNPGSGARNPASGYTEEQWAEFAKGMAVVVDRCRSRGYQPVFHNETGTFVEAPAEVARMLEVSEIGLCMDAGHFLVGGGDPVEYVKKWGDRIDHVHIKTADLPRFQEVVDEGLPTNAIWEGEVFPKLGEGALDVDAFLAALREIDYAGWLVVEQDIFPTTAERFAQAAADQRANREFLKARGL